MYSYVYDAADPNCYENRVECLSPISTLHWAFHVRVHDVDAALAILANHNAATGEYLVDDGWEEWAEGSSGIQDHLVVYLMTPHPLEVGPELMQILGDTVDQANGCVISTAGDWSAQL